jgi:hypothetical protein
MMRAGVWQRNAHPAAISRRDDSRPHAVEQDASSIRVSFGRSSRVIARAKQNRKDGWIVAGAREDSVNPEPSEACEADNVEAGLIEAGGFDQRDAGWYVLKGRQTAREALRFTWPGPRGSAGRKAADGRRLNGGSACTRVDLADEQDGR